MPVYIDINENRVLGPIFRNGERQASFAAKYRNALARCRNGPKHD